jgi:predicted phage terminase large subunit-like protein
MADGGATAVRLPPAFRAFVAPMRHKVAYGGRGGGKSWAVARMLLLKGGERPLRILCTREVQRSIKDSVLKLLADQIAALGMGWFYDVQATTIKGANGTEFLFAGLQDHTVESIKSYEGVDIAWVEEAQSVSERSAEILVPTIRKPDSELWWTFNPTREDDYVWQRFVVKGDAQAVVIKVNHGDNPWFPDVLNVERLRLKAINEDLYRHVWEGECRTAAGMLFKREWFKFYDRAPERLNVYIASDYAVTPDEGDFTEHGVWGIDQNGELYALDWWSGQTDPDTWISAWLALVKRWNPLYAFEESGVILRAVGGAIDRAMRHSDTYVVRQPIASAGNKLSRALGFAARASAGTVWLPKHSPWTERLVNQLCAFDGQDGHVDDAVDVCSLVARGLTKMADALPAPQQPKHPKIGTFAWLTRDQDEHHGPRTF